MGTDQVGRSGADEVIVSLGRDVDAGLLKVSPLHSFADLLWDVDSADEVFALEAGVEVSSTDSPRQVVAQQIRGNVRYWATQNREPVALAGGGVPTELGEMEDWSILSSFCRSFLIEKLNFSGIDVPRIVRRRK